MSKVLRKLSKASPTTKEEIAELMEEMRGESSRVVGILVGALVEEDLKKLLKSHMVNLSSDEEEALFGDTRLLGTLGAKIQVAYAFGIIPTNTMHDLNLVRAIRNAHAHSQRTIKFESPELQQICDRFFAKADAQKHEWKKLNAKERFIQIMKALMLDMLFLTGTNHKGNCIPPVQFGKNPKTLRVGEKL